MAAVIPVLCVETHPTKQTVTFLGVAINLTAIAKSYEPPLDRTYLSHIFAGKRMPAYEYGRQIAAAMGMSPEAFYEGLRQQREGK